MSDQPSLRIDGEVGQALTLTFDELTQWSDESRVADVSQLDASRRGVAIRLAAIMEKVQVGADATHLGLHSSLDDFHASIPLAPVVDRGLLIYSVDNQPLDVKAGGPFRFFIPDHSACHVDEIDECANVKFVDHLEFTNGKGFDNRPEDDDEHEALHRRQEG